MVNTTQPEPFHLYNDAVTYYNHPEWMAIVAIKGYGIEFLLDTGSALSIISPYTAKQLDLQISPTSLPANGLGGKFMFDGKTSLMVSYKEHSANINFLTPSRDTPNILGRDTINKLQLPLQSGLPIMLYASEAVGINKNRAIKENVNAENLVRKENSPMFPVIDAHGRGHERDDEVVSFRTPTSQPSCSQVKT